MENTKPVAADYLVRLFGLEGDVAFITGGGGAIGAATARAYASAGAAVAVADKAHGAAERVADDVKAMGGQVLAVSLDVTQERSVQAAVEEATRQFGKVDILVNNAGINIRKPPQELTALDWQTVMDVNVTGYFLCARAMGPGMVARKSGRIINVASIMGFRGSSITTNLAYNTSKGAVVNFTRTLAGEWAPHGVRVNAIAPTYLLTPLTEKLLSDPGVHAKIVARTPMGTVGTPEDLVGAMLFLGSHASRLVTGHILAVDGGWLAW
jgi:NAD(P)-dependent dehydrogenase (short-subunit alcohol dehydrogenase family)